MQIVQLFVNGEQVDMFKDESITISDSVANVKDISKIYTTYSRQFTLPASKTNNRIFKHYYNFNVVGNSFDARFKVDAYLNVNGMRYKDGKLRLSGVKLKDNSPESYQVTFFGNAVALKDLFGEDTLSMLTGGTEGLNTYNHTYDNLTVRSSFNNSTQLFAGTPRAGDIKYSFISHTKVFGFDGTNIADLSYLTGDINRYVSLTDLKPSLRLKSIIKAIQEKYNITFSQDFFNTAYFKNLYMWLHKQAGVMTQAANENSLTTYFADFGVWTLTSGTEYRETDPTSPYYGDLFTYTEPSVIPFPTGIDEVRYILETYTINTTFVDYNVAVRDGVVYSSSGTGNTTFTIGQLNGGTMGSNSGPQTYSLDFTISSTAVHSPTQSISLQKQIRNSFGEWVDSGSPSVYGVSATAVTTYLDVPSQMPNMKVYDFIINLFKMHQLTASIEKDLNGTETVEVLPLQDYYSTGVTHDITKNIDVSSTQVDRIVPYKEINFTYKGRGSAAITAFDQAFPNNKFGDLNWNAGTNDMDGQAYSIELGFEHMYFERIISSGGIVTDVQYGAMVNQDIEPIVGLPLIHCIVLRSTLSPNLRWNNGDATTTLLTEFNAPTNIDASNNSIHWGAEYNEYTALQENSSLYNRYYFDSVTSVFAQNSRKLTYKAYLPLGLLLSYELRDRFRIGQNTFKIESINTNLQNQESTLVLYNDLPPASTGGIIIDPQGDVPVIIEKPTPCDKSLVWNYMDDVIGYVVYLNEKEVAKVNQDTPFYEFPDLDFESTNTVGVQARYSTSVYSRLVSVPTPSYDLFWYINNLRVRATSEKSGRYEGECCLFNALLDLTLDPTGERLFEKYDERCIAASGSTEASECTINELNKLLV